MKKEEFIKNYIIDRRGTNSTKWDQLKEKYGRDDLIAMWIADTEFHVPECVEEALIKRAKLGAFGYSFVPDSYYKAYSDWMQNRHGFPVKKDWVRFSTGCITLMAWMINAFTQKDDSILILTPVYYPFRNVIEMNYRNPVAVDLVYKDNTFYLDLDAIEEAIVKNNVKMFLLCSPHNPAGRVWTEKELKDLLGLCRKHHVLVVSDEIHQDIIPGSHQFIPAAVVDNGAYRDMVLTINSASKSFNMASRLHAHAIIPDEKLRAEYDRYCRGINRTEMNVMGLAATEAAYTNGGEWFDASLEVIRDNYNYLKSELERNEPKIHVCALEGTYLAFLDFREVVPAEKVKDFIIDQCHIAADFGEQFGENWQGFARLNLATDPEYVKKAVSNIISALKK